MVFVSLVDIKVEKFDCLHFGLQDIQCLGMLVQNKRSIGTMLLGFQNTSTVMVVKKSVKCM